jgi:hypothetical protein
LKIIDNIGSAFVIFAKPGVKPKTSGMNTPTQIGNYYRNYTPIKGTKNNPLKRKEIIQRLK